MRSLEDDQSQVRELAALLTSVVLRFDRRSFGEDQLAVPRLLQAVKIAAVSDPHLVSAAREVLESHQFRRVQWNFFR